MATACCLMVSLGWREGALSLAGPSSASARTALPRSAPARRREALELVISAGSGLAGALAGPPPALARRMKRQLPSAADPDLGKGGEDSGRLPASYFGGATSDFTELPSGLQVLDLQPGQGSECCAEGVATRVDWSIRTFKGARVEESLSFNQSAAQGQPEAAASRPPELQFVPLKLVEGIRGLGMRDDVVEGIREGVIGMRVGGTRRLLVPPSLGWLSEDQQPMPVDYRRRRRLEELRKEPLVVDLRLRELLPQEPR